MKVYLTGIDAIKASRRNYNQKEVKKPKKNQIIMKKKTME